VRYPLTGDPSTPVVKLVLLSVVFLPAYLLGLAGVARR
jgi:hypothetical protein